MIHVMLRGIFRMFGRMKMMPMGQMGMMARRLVLAGLVMFSRFAMMLGSLLVMLGGFLMVLGAFMLGHICKFSFTIPRGGTHCSRSQARSGSLRREYHRGGYD